VGGKIAYVTFKGKHRLLAAVTSQIRADMIREREVPLLEDRIDDDTGEPIIVHNEDLLNALAASRAQAFVETRIVREAFLEEIRTGLAPVYSVAEEQWSGFKRAKNRVTFF
jgi:hypothetical protein